MRVESSGGDGSRHTQMLRVAFTTAMMTAINDHSPNVGQRDARIVVLDGRTSSNGVDLGAMQSWKPP